MTLSNWAWCVFYTAWWSVVVWVLSEIKKWHCGVRLLFGCVSCLYVTFVTIAICQLVEVAHVGQYVGFLQVLADESKKGNDMLVRNALSAYIDGIKSFDGRLVSAREALKHGEAQNTVTNEAAIP